jgi:protein gp37
MSDLFHPDVPDEFIVSVAEVMIQGDWHNYQVLTKRAERLEKLLNSKLKFATVSSHIWWGVSVEDRKHGIPRIEHLRNTPAAIKFLSIEPLLQDLGLVNLKAIDWVIVGGESGRGARPMEQVWVQQLLRQCTKQKVTFFFKQWGGTNKKAAGRILNGRTYDDLPILQ